MAAFSDQYYVRDTLDAMIFPKQETNFVSTSFPESVQERFLEVPIPGISTYFPDCHRGGGPSLERKPSERKRKRIETKAEGETKGEAEGKRKDWQGISSKVRTKGQKKAAEGGTTDYVHVRARRGQATDSHSLAERARREKISAKMKQLQSLVPGCDKIIGKIRVLDAIIDYVQALQSQVELLSGKISSVSSMINDFGSELGTNALNQEGERSERVGKMQKTTEMKTDIAGKDAEQGEDADQLDGVMSEGRTEDEKRCTDEGEIAATREGNCDFGLPLELVPSAPNDTAKTPASSMLQRYVLSNITPQDSESLLWSNCMSRENSSRGHPWAAGQYM